MMDMMDMMDIMGIMMNDRNSNLKTGRQVIKNKIDI